MQQLDTASEAREMLDAPIHECTVISQDASGTQLPQSARRCWPQWSCCNTTLCSMFAVDCMNDRNTLRRRSGPAMPQGRIVDPRVQARFQNAGAWSLRASALA